MLTCAWRITKSRAEFQDLRLGSSSGFGFENPLFFLELLPAIQETAPNAVRYTLGFGYPAPLHQKNSLPFFCLPRRFGPLRAPHNRQVEDGRPLPFKSFWAHHF